MTISRDAWQGVLIKPDISVFDAIAKMDKQALGVLLVVDKSNKLLGVVTDGDIRRHFLKRKSLDESISTIMNTQPKVSFENEGKEKLIQKFHEFNILHLPIVNLKNEVIGLEMLSNITEIKKLHNPVVLMAGGLGTRLHPLTLNFPKPMVKIGNKPILEILLENFIAQGFHEFYFSVNFKASLIQEYFSTGEKWGVTIHYLKEETPLGTAGSLCLLPKFINKPFLVMNADIMTNLNFEKIIEYHESQSKSTIATVCARQHENTIPYGVMHIDDRTHQLIYIEEKPTQTYFVNAGIYVLNPCILNQLPSEAAYLDMPTLLTRLIDENQHVSTFPIREYWLDVGTHESLAKANYEYENILS